MQLPGLTSSQNQVIAAISGGATIKAAADAAQVHRNTIAYWCQTSHYFREALNDAQYDRAVSIREQAQEHAAQAYAVILEIMTDPNASPSARLKAAKMIIDIASTPPKPKPVILYKVEKFMPAEVAEHLAKQAAAAPKHPDLDLKNVHSFAQSPPLAA